MRVLIEDLLLLARADEQSLVMRKKRWPSTNLPRSKAARVRREREALSMPTSAQRV